MSCQCTPSRKMILSIVTQAAGGGPVGGGSKAATPTVAVRGRRAPVVEQVMVWGKEEEQAEQEGQKQE